MALKLVLAIQSSLDALELANATFLAEILVGFLPQSDDALYWLARCHFARGRPGAVVEILKAARSVTARFLYARACVELSRLDDAEYALVEMVDADGVVHLRSQDSQDAEQEPCPLVEPPSNASLLALAGQVYQLSQRKLLACHCYTRALAINPFLWTAYEQLCRLGGVATNNMPPEIFSPDKAIVALASLRDSRPCSLLFRGGSSSPSDQHTHLRPPNGRPISAPGPSAMDPAVPRASENQKRPRSDTPGSSPVRLGGSGPAKVAATEEARAKRFQSRMPLSRLLQPNPAPSAGSPAAAPDVEATGRPGTGPAATATTTASTVASEDTEMADIGPEPPAPTSPPPPIAAARRITASLLTGLPSLMSTLTTLALAHLALKQHKRPKARRLIHTRLTPHLQSTALAHRFLALTYEHDTSLVVHALTHLRRAHALAPWDPLGMDAYSSQLWMRWGKGQGAEAELARVAQYLGTVVPQAPETLVALGNLASREEVERGGGKDRAIELFKRAGQVQVGYAYGWTLIGHEYRDLNKVDGAVDAFNRALSVDPEMVSAWSGLGYTYEDMRQSVLAMQCFQHAFELSGLAMYESHIGHSLLDQGKFTEAIAVLESAIKHNDKSSITKLALAKTYLGMDRPEPAMPLLQQVLTESPSDSEIHYLIAFTHNLLGDKKAAVRALLDCQAHLAPETHGHVVRALLDQLEANVEVELGEVMERVADALEAARDRSAGGMGMGHGVEDSVELQ
ncbi:hypothetical protein BCR44DRAFT_1509641 [Catenaria anguillulae PL171]|uniref:Uncharacterized protein n=1 Tax=Catenaria anguillulae PL171 TaxID=765915 RepID=A0A1Y2I0K0_9FUNG|nr:hypothetical protein BCR44DRAFT_1509641 [Catenaria anguillulae PL171]